MFWIMLASTILGAGEVVAGGIHQSVNLKKLAKEWKPVIAKIQQDNQLMAELEAAYARKDARLIQQIMNASPFSSDFRKMREDLKKNQQDTHNLSKLKVSMANQQAELQDEYNRQLQKAQGTGSIIGNLIQGGVDTSKLEYKGSGITENKIKEVNNV